MSLGKVKTLLTSRPWTQRSVPWLGALLIGVIIALSAYDIVRSYRATVSEIGKELDSQARVIAEQTARTLQAVDLVLRHLAEKYRDGAISKLNAEDLHVYLKEQAVGLVQIDGLGMFGETGLMRAGSFESPEQTTGRDAAPFAIFQALRENRNLGMYVDTIIEVNSAFFRFIPLARRLETSSGEFAGIVTARGRINYFQEFYRDIRTDQGTTIALMHQGGAMLARYPPNDASLGLQFPSFQEMLKTYQLQRPEPTRTISPVDGVERFGALHLVPDYPLAIIVTRDVNVALAAWRAQSAGIAIRTVALGALAAWLLWIVMQQLSRLNEARASLEVSQERYALAVAGSDDGIWDFDFRANRVFASARAREILGLPPGPEMQSKDEWFASLQFHPEDAPRRLAAMEAHYKGESPAYVGEFRVKHPDGGYRWVRHHGLCVRDATGKPYRMAGSVSDIDARKRAEESLRHSEERFALAVAGSNDGIIDWDIVADRMYTSERTMRITGVESTSTMHTRAEWVAMLKLHPDDRERHAEDLRRHLDGQSNVREGEYRLLHPNGEYRWVRLRNICIRDAEGRPLRLAGSVSDIDAYKRIEAALRESEERYALAVAGSNEGLWDWDLACDVMFVSPRAQEFMGLEPSEPRRPRREWIARSPYHPDDLPLVRAALSAHLRGVAKHYVVEYRMWHPSGAWRWYRQRGIALRGEGDQPYRMAGSMEDITDSKNADAERARLEVKLRQAQKLEAMGTLAGGIAHDFNNILSAILGYGEMVQKDAGEGTALRRHIDAAMNAGMRAKALVERILAFSRSGMGERVPVHVESIVDEALELVAASLPSTVRLDCRLDAGNAAVMGDPTQVHQVVMNLCTNAVQAMPSGGVLTVSLELVEMPATMLSTSSLTAGDYLRLKVQDTGVGIAANVMERIFDPFFTTKEVGVGAGLGLSLVHGIVTDLGGGIDVESRAGEGAIFTVYLPRSGNVTAPSAVEEPIAIGNGEVVLLVDDEAMLVRLGEEMIAELGYEPVGFTSSATALQTFRDSPERFDVVLSDEAMPGMTGSELAKEIHEIRPDIPIVLMSGYVSSGLSLRAQEAGVMDILSKPLVSRDIARSLANAVRR